ncbi:hypothetical protein A3Q56_01220 [Intoshia linei]|uniref:non-specific serine/threonine protein kinase n=1 Tax=Intoshia linei TaxID=1819745 RepID=A0A177B9Z7_9BILA|nr:hypothetical protein A3Q56_01220 [Intoshia linei]
MNSQNPSPIKPVNLNNNEESYKLLYNSFLKKDSLHIFCQYFPSLCEKAEKYIKLHSDIIKFNTNSVHSKTGILITMEEVLTQDIHKILCKLEIPMLSNNAMLISLCLESFRNDFKKMKSTVKCDQDSTNITAPFSKLNINKKTRSYSLFVTSDNSHRPWFRSNSYTSGVNMEKKRKKKNNILLMSNLPIGNSNPSLVSDLFDPDRYKKFIIRSKHKRDSSLSTIHRGLNMTSRTNSPDPRTFIPSKMDSDFSLNSSLSQEHEFLKRTTTFRNSTTGHKSWLLNMFNTRISNHGSCESLQPVNQKVNSSMDSNQDNIKLLDDYAVEAATDDYLSQIKNLNMTFRQKFPTAISKMEKSIEDFIKEPGSWNILSDPSSSFILTQLRNIAASIQLESKENKLSYHHFFEAIREIKEIVSNIVKSQNTNLASCHEIIKKANDLLFVFSKPSRLLQCLEFDPFDFVSSVNMADEEAKLRLSMNGESFSKIPSVIIDKLGMMNKNESTINIDKSVKNVKLTKRFNRERNIEQYEFIKIISNGAYGSVSLVRSTRNNEYYALKRISKQSIAFNNQMEQVISERDIMHIARHPCVVHLICSFETPNALNLVMEYIQGGDCRTFLERIGVFPVEYARQYVSEVVLALEYIHSLGIVHKDMKPENLLITRTGHIKLTDFGLSKIGAIFKMTCYELETDPFNDGKIIGTPEYIAPEVILTTGYGPPVDWWALGVILHEFVIGETPFHANSPKNVFLNILYKDLSLIGIKSTSLSDPEAQENDEIPKCNIWEDISNDCVLLIKELLIRNPLYRLGGIRDDDFNRELVASASNSTSGFLRKTIKNHDFFKSVIWKNVIEKEALFIPKIDCVSDTSYFEDRNERYNHGEFDSETDDNADILSSSFTCVAEKDDNSNKSKTKITNQYVPILSTLDKYRSGYNLSASFDEKTNEKYLPSPESVGSMNLSSSEIKCKNVTKFSNDTAFRTYLNKNVGNISRKPQIKRNKSVITKTPLLDQLKQTLNKQYSDSGNSSRDETPPPLVIKTPFTNSLSKSKSYHFKSQSARPTSAIDVHRNAVPLANFFKKNKIQFITKTLKLVSKNNYSYGFTMNGIAESHENIPKLIHIKKRFNKNNENSKHIIRHHVTSVDASGPAYKAGLRKGFIISHIDNFPLDGINHFDAVLRLLRKKTIKLTVICPNF